MEAPENIYIQPNAKDGWFEGPMPEGSEERFVRYVIADIFIEKAATWISEHTSLSEKLTIEDFCKYMKG